MALSALADGASVFRDAVFPARFQHIAALNRLGARIQKRASTAEVAGAPALCGAEVRATDLRAAAALMLAGLAATGVTTLRGVQHLDRGYERLDQKLGCLGASIERVAVHHFRASVSETEISRPRTS
jgi:UDP-N-acetylglucosamine 1-carboxyvinyltransferase